MIFSDILEIIGWSRKAEKQFIPLSIVFHFTINNLNYQYDNN